jgi:hypothetical protein
VQLRSVEPFAGNYLQDVIEKRLIGGCNRGTAANIIIAEVGLKNIAMSKRTWTKRNSKEKQKDKAKQ